MIDQNTQHAFIQGDEHALEKIIHVYTSPLLRYCTAIMCNAEEAKDVVQETFIKAYEKRRLFKAKTSLNAWLYRIAYTTAIDTLRKHKRREKLIPLVAQVEPNNSQSQSGISEPLYSILICLTVKERTLLFGRVLEERPYKELALILNSSESALRKSYQRLIRKLALEMEQEEGHDFKLMRSE